MPPESPPLPVSAAAQDIVPARPRRLRPASTPAQAAALIVAGLLAVSATAMGAASVGRNPPPLPALRPLPPVASQHRVVFPYTLAGAIRDDSHTAGRIETSIRRWARLHRLAGHAATYRTQRDRAFVLSVFETGAKPKDMLRRYVRATRDDGSVFDLAGSVDRVEGGITYACIPVHGRVEGSLCAWSSGRTANVVQVRGRPMADAMRLAHSIHDTILPGPETV